MRKRARDKKIELVPANTNTHIPANIAPPLDHYSSRCMSQLDLSIHTLASSAGLGLDLPNEWIISDEINDLNGTAKFHRPVRATTDTTFQMTYWPKSSNVWRMSLQNT